MKNRLLKNTSGNILSVLSSIVGIFLSLLIIVPIWLLLVDSLSSVQFYEIPGIHWWPKELSFESYKVVFSKDIVLTAYKNTILRAFIGTVLGTLITFCAAYSLSKKQLLGRKIITLMFIFTMYFGGGLIPTYINIKDLGLINSFWVFILPMMGNAFHLIIARNFMYSIPKDIEDSAMIDGANDYAVLFRIIAPLSMPIIATIALWNAVDQWNAWFDAMIYITDSKFTVLQLLIRNIIMENQIFEEALEAASSQKVTSGSVRAATIFVAVGPIIIIYPFIQKYFVKGVMIGAVK